MKFAEKRIRLLFSELRPELLKAHGEIEQQVKSDSSVVTEMDLLVENRLKTVLNELDPTIGFSGEETGVDYTQKTFWLADPIDGTESFIRGLPFSSNMVALIDNGEPVMSVIYNFFLDEYFLAIKGHGATKNGHPIRVSDRPLSRSFVIAGHKLGLEGFVNAIPRLSEKVQGLPQMYSSGYEFSSVASGRIDGFIAWNKDAKAWDRAPGTLL
ncbi:MAG: inositol monophosphatase family protein, partial [Acidobacteriota bacterium]